MIWLLDAYRDPNTLKVARYLVLGLPLGILEFTFVVTGVALGLGLLVTLIGIPVMVITLLGVRGLARLERELATSLLEAQFPNRRWSRQSSDFFWQRLRRLFRDRDTWRAVAFTVLRLPLGIADFTVVTTIVSLALGGFAQPILFAIGVDSRIGDFVIDSFAESLIYLPFSLLFLLAGPRLLLGWSNVPRAVASRLLGGVGRAELKHEVATILSRAGEADAFEVSDELSLRFGHGPFPSLVQVQATLLALEETGRVAADRRSTKTLYRLAHHG